MQMGEEQITFFNSDLIKTFKFEKVGFCQTDVSKLLRGAASKSTKYD